MTSSNIMLLFLFLQKKVHNLKKKSQKTSSSKISQIKIKIKSAVPTLIPLFIAIALLHYKYPTPLTDHYHHLENHLIDHCLSHHLFLLKNILKSNPTPHYRNRDMSIGRSQTLLNLHQHHQEYHQEYHQVNQLQ